MRIVAFAVVTLLCAHSRAGDTNDARRRAWNAPQAPFHVFGNTYYVGVHGLAAILVAGSDGLVLLDAGLPESAPLVMANIRALGFRVDDVKLILNTHAHYDHAGGIAAIQAATHAIVKASPASAAVLSTGHLTKDDPQFTPATSAPGKNVVDDTSFPAVPSVALLKDGDVVRLGDSALTAHFTPGHTPGSTTWSWQSCDAGKCLDVVYADSLNPVSSTGFHFRPLAKAFTHSIDVVAALPCDLLLTVHPEFAELLPKLEQRQKSPTTNPFVDPARASCRTYADDARGRLMARIASE